MGVQIERCLQLRPLVSGLTWPQPLYLPRIVTATKQNTDSRGSGSGSGLVSRKNALCLSCSRDTIRDPLFFRRRLVRMNCRIEATDGYRKESVKTSADQIEQFPFEFCGDTIKDVSQNPSVSKEFSMPEKQGSTNVPVLAEGVSMPSSLRKLKKQQVQKRLQEAEDSAGDLTCSIRNTFSSMVFIIRSVQNYTLQMRQILLVESDIRGISAMVHREMQMSFIWLFEQVYASTPKLMVSVMILLTNFTVFSVGNIIIPESTSSTELAQAIQWVLSDDFQNKNGNNVDAVFGTGFARSKFEIPSGSTKDLDPGSTKVLDSCEQINTSLAGMRSRSISNDESLLVAGRGSDEGEGCTLKRATRYLEEESYPPELHAAAQKDVLNMTDKAMIKNRSSQEQDLILESSAVNETVIGGLKSSDSALQSGSSNSMIRPFFNEAVKDLRLASEVTFEDGFHDRGTMFVAPVVAKLEPDKYECYDRTDLTYQHALALDCQNAMLLANYAQFLYVVRHDHDRAEKYFQRAMNAVPLDGEAMSKFAMFLWLARRNRSAAERVFKAAIAVDPTNPFYEGEYAHFLSHAEE